MCKYVHVHVIKETCLGRHIHVGYEIWVIYACLTVCLQKESTFVFSLNYGNVATLLSQVVTVSCHHQFTLSPSHHHILTTHTLTLLNTAPTHTDSPYPLTACQCYQTAKIRPSLSGEFNNYGGNNRTAVSTWNVHVHVCVLMLKSVISWHTIACPMSWIIQYSFPE